MEECEEYCEGATLLSIDKSSWLSNTGIESTATEHESEHSTTESEKNSINKKSKTNSSIGTMKKATQKRQTMKGKQSNEPEKKKQKINQIRSNDDIESSISNLESSIIYDSPNNKSINDNTPTFHRQSQHIQSENGKRLTTEANSGESIILSDNNTDNDQLILPRHIQLELTNNRKQIVDLENQLKEMKRTSIRKHFY